MRNFVSLVVVLFGAASSGAAQLDATGKSVTHLDLRHDQFVSQGTPYYRNGAAPETSSLGLTWRDSARWRGIGLGKVDLTDEYSSSESWNYLIVRDLYIERRVAGVQWSLGRRRERWSEWESTWRQGLFEPRSMINRLRNEPLGLTGLFTSGHLREWKWTVGALALHVPDSGAHFSIADNRFVSRNPWFRPPVASYQLGETVGQIRYSVKTPEILDVGLNPGLVGKVERGSSFGGSRLSVGYKPIPQFRLGFPSYNRVVVASEEDFFAVEINPRVQYHYVASTDFWRHWQGWDWTASVAYDRPEAQPADSTWTTQTYSPTWAYALGTSKNTEVGRLRFGFLRLIGGDDRDQGVFARDSRLFEGRFQYAEAWLAAWSVGPRSLWKRPFVGEVRLVWDRQQNGGAVELSAEYQVNRRWRVFSEADVLGLLPGAARQTDGFFALYRANDRVSAGMTYVF
ncbi:MAG: hypothetical protein AB7F86_11235 [Bdellovibrionales bacterium]